MVALGLNYGGYFTNDFEMKEKFNKLSGNFDELIW